MIDEFNKIIIIAKKFNKAANEKIFSSKFINEQKENIDDFKKLENKLSTILANLQHLDPNDDKAIAKLLVNTHVRLADIQWHLSEVHDLVKKLMQFYGKRLPADLQSLDD